MCLRRFERWTFSERGAFLRLAKHIKDSPNQLRNATIFFICDSKISERERYDMPYHNLLSHAKIGVKFRVIRREVKNWDEWDRYANMIQKKNHDVFGNIELELMVDS